MNPAVHAFDAPSFELPLFPLQSVLFPGGLLGLKVFEARYLDLVGRCLRESEPFGVVALKSGSEVKGGSNTAERLETIGCLAELIDVDGDQPGILQVRCRGTQRFSIAQLRQEPNHLWVAEARLLAADEPALPSEELTGSARGLANAIATLKQQGSTPFLEPYRFDDAGWLANRWCEILPIPLAAKQKLMELPDALVRLKLVDDFLRSKGVVA
ncbi:MAG TPA: LON peptidase substrate-binding domain-containing protein [Methylibium sp.]|uniref:LON peptidase substrate-binding domain-containing protein n=1 Tax=Methylibium sp. TaxID=2067992 RepID=UPI002DB597D6|nr:LON peptidase substrate-binding domain-containing protein [Methylibium sp.]HEU4460793.1 LON peptidase substrate-binding domain-containing protein [Methylibium sp.]